MRSPCSRIVIMLSFFLAVLLCALSPATAQDKAAAGKSIRVQADRLVVDNNDGTAEFIGHVKATQNKTLIRADRLKIYYSGSGDPNQPMIDSKRTVKKVVASGGVYIRMDENTASSSSAVYDIEKRVLTLSGPSSKIVSGKNSVTGAKIRLHRDTGQINVDGDGKKPIEAVFNPGKGGLQ